MTDKAYNMSQNGNQKFKNRTEKKKKEKKGYHLCKQSPKLSRAFHPAKSQQKSLDSNTSKIFRKIHILTETHIEQLSTQINI